MKQNLDCQHHTKWTNYNSAVATHLQQHTHKMTNSSTNTAKQRLQVCPAPDQKAQPVTVCVCSSTARGWLTVSRVGQVCTCSLWCGQSSDNKARQLMAGDVARNGVSLQGLQQERPSLCFVRDTCTTRITSPMKPHAQCYSKIEDSNVRLTPKCMTIQGHKMTQ